MYTVILYKNDGGCLIEKYKFLFFSFQEDNQINLCPYEADTKAAEIVNTLNGLTQSRREWRLIVFAGAGYHIKKRPGKGMEKALEQGIPEEVRKLIRLYTRKGSGDLPRVSGYFPDQLYCVVCGDRPIAQSRSSGLFTVDDAREFGGSFRMFWFDMDTSSRKNEMFDWFRLDCILLILAVNQIPSGSLEYGYLYHLDIDIDDEQFDRYVLEQEMRLKKVGQYLETVSDSLQRVRKTGEGYVEDTAFEDTLDECRRSMRKPGVIRELRRKDLRHQTQVERVLEANRREIHARIYFPKGLLREEAARIQDRVEKRPGAEDFLSAAGRDLLERRVWEKLEDICKKKRVPLKQTEYEREYEEREEAVRQCARKKMDRRVKVLACLLLSVLECVMLMPFLIYSVRSGSATVLYSVMQWFHMDKLPWEGTKMMLTVAMLWVGCAAFAGMAVLLCSLVREMWLIHMYHKHVCVRINKRQEQRIQYYEDVVNLLAEYQYCIRLLREQRERELNWEAKMKGLQNHRNVWKQNSAVCRQLRFFTRRDGEYADVPTVSFDIQEDPRQIEYYWIPFKEGQGKAELNGSGYYVRGIFGFITGIHIVKTLV